MAAERLVVTPDAIDDAIEAYRWYERKRAGLGQQFLDRLQRCLQAISEFPRSGRPVRATFRKAVVQKFPYVVIYECEHNLVVVHSVFHTGQDPKKWQDRLN